MSHFEQSTKYRRTPCFINASHKGIETKNDVNKTKEIKKWCLPALNRKEAVLKNKINILKKEVRFDISNMKTWGRY